MTNNKEWHHEADGDYGADIEFGFSWGPMRVQRCELGPNGERTLHIETDYQKLMVVVSAAGQSIRVFRVRSWSEEEKDLPEAVVGP